MGFCGRSAEVILAAIGLKERSDGEVTVKCGECTGFSIKTADGASSLVGLNDTVRQGCVSQILGH